MNESVFISYSSKEFNEALLLKGILEKNGISCWMAPESIPGGSNYAKEIPKAIKACRVFVILLSSKAQDSIWVSKELNQALVDNKVIMPYMIEDCPLMEQFDFYLSDVQRYDAFVNRSEAIKKMVNEIRAVLECGGPTPVIDDIREVHVKKPEASKKELPLSLWLALSYFLCIPAGVAVTVPYILYKLKKADIYKSVTLVLSFLGCLVGLIIYLVALSNPSHLDEAFTTSIIGWITMIFS